MHADYAIAGKFPTRNICLTCSRSSHAFRKRVRILPVRRKTFEVTTLKRRKLFQLTSDNERRPDGASDGGCEWILSSYRPWLGRG